ncbi:hypothetical protein niasHT_031756 [Heterodera trifolii]|uniref:Uncharacterized protein n=1 Tax=Heterodera trifolii TaxID=157864 RepID=A0ABD2IMY7_9BILA
MEKCHLRMESAVFEWKSAIFEWKVPFLNGKVPSSNGKLLPQTEHVVHCPGVAARLLPGCSSRDLFGQMH